MFGRQHSYGLLVYTRPVSEHWSDAPCNVYEFRTERSHALYTIEQVLETLQRCQLMIQAEPLRR